VIASGSKKGDSINREMKELFHRGYANTLNSKSHTFFGWNQKYGTCLDLSNFCPIIKPFIHP
jgi:hypothetical protein